jgi:deoxyribonuclease-4
MSTRPTHRPRPERRFGKHCSIAGGLPRALERAAEGGCTALQLFSRNPRGWATRPLEAEEAEAFREARAGLDLHPVIVHDNYLINLASPDPLTLARSVEAFRDEIVRALQIGADYLVTHPGSTRGGSAAQGVATCVEAIKTAADGLDLGGLTILIENTAGQGSCVGRSFEEVAEIVDGCERGLPTAVCLDTAHTFAAGYDISSPGGFRNTMSALGATVGFGRVRAIHFNDSKSALGSNSDRHWHLGEGRIGLEGLARVARFKPLVHAPLILETPDDDIHDDAWNLDQLRSMLGEHRHTDR